MDIRAYLADRSTDVVCPEPKSESDYRAEFDFAVLRTQDFLPMADWPSSKQVARKSKGIADDARKLLKHFDGLPLPLSHWLAKGVALDIPVDIGALRAVLDALGAEARFHAETAISKKGAQPRSKAKEYAADAAYRLISKFSIGRRPTTTKGGPFFELASLIFEAASGKHADLSAYCKEVLTNWRTHDAKPRRVHRA